MATRDHLEQTAVLAGAAVRSLARRGGGAGLVRAAPGLSEIALALLIGAVLLSISYGLFAPLPAPKTLPIGPAAVADDAGPARIIENPFRIVSLAPVAPAAAPLEDYAETSLDLTLHGVLDIDGDASAFIETPNGEQARFEVGDEIWNGVTLDRIDPDRVVLLSAGVRETLRLINREENAPGPAPAARPATGQAPATDLRPGGAASIAIGDIASVTPRLGPGGLRLVVAPGPDAIAFAASGLEPGDEVVAINNRRLTADIAGEARRLAGVAGSDSVTLLVERDGVTIPVSIDLAAVRGEEGRL